MLCGALEPAHQDSNILFACQRVPGMRQISAHVMTRTPDKRQSEPQYIGIISPLSPYHAPEPVLLLLLTTLTACAMFDNAGKVVITGCTFDETHGNKTVYNGNVHNAPMHHAPVFSGPVRNAPIYYGTVHTGIVDNGHMYHGDSYAAAVAGEHIGGYGDQSYNERGRCPYHIPPAQPPRCLILLPAP